MSERVYALISFPPGFKEKFFGIINNINAVNSNKELPMRLEECYQKTDYAAIPKKNKHKEINDEL